MKQVLYTSCEAGKSLNGADGFQVRGASMGLGERVHAVVPYMGYSLPADANPLQFSASSAPVRLAFLKIPELGAILCHGVSAGLDPSTHRPGNFFSHVFLDLPSGFTARAAIKTWESDSWRRADGPFDVALPDVEDIPCSDSLNDEGLQRLLSSERGQKLFRFVLSAVLTTPQDWRIFVAAPSHEIAFCVYGLTRVLPESCQRRLTFSTYESAPLNCPARLVGNWSECPDTDMPSSCYCGKAVGYSSQTGRASAIATDGAFIELATQAVAGGDRTRLDGFLAVCGQCAIDRPQLLNLACRAELGRELSKGDLLELAPLPRFLSRLLEKPNLRRLLLDQCITDRKLTEVLVMHVVSILKENRQSLAAVQQAAEEALREAIWQGKLNQVQTLFERILPAIDDAATDSTRLAFLDELANPQTVPWPTRAYLLTQMASIPSTTPGLLRTWLAPVPTELPLLCSLPIPEVWKTQACLTCLRHAGVTDPLIDTLEMQNEVMLNVLDRVPGDKGADQYLARLVAALLARSNAPLRLIVDVIRDRGRCRPEVTSAFLAAAARNSNIDVFCLASQCGARLLHVLDSGSAYDVFFTGLLDYPPEKLLSDRQVVALLRAAAPKKAPSTIRDAINALLLIESYLHVPVLDKEGLGQLAVAVRTLPSATVRSAVMDAVLKAVLAEMDSPAIGDKVENAVQSLGTYTQGGPVGFYRLLLGRLRTAKGFWKRQHLLSALLAIGLGATGSSNATQMADLARDLAEDIARRSRRRVFAFIDGQSRDWPDEARLRWRLFVKFVRPSGILSRVSSAWAKIVSVPLTIVCLALVTSKMSCRSEAVGTNVAGDGSRLHTSRTANDALARGIDYDRPQP